MRRTVAGAASAAKRRAIAVAVTLPHGFAAVAAPATVLRVGDAGQARADGKDGKKNSGTLHGERDRAVSLNIA